MAAHVYYRALTAIPSLIRTWWTDCKDRQLSTAFAAFTAAYFSPVLVASELANLREPSGTGGRDRLEDDALSIKVSQVISEVSVIYLVDEQQMEMAVKLPAEYPLKLVEVRDVRRVGVAEEKWRGWLFAVQQIISTQVFRPWSQGVMSLVYMNLIEWPYCRCSGTIQKECHAAL